MTRRAWLPATEQRILKPALAALDEDVRADVEADLERLLNDPDNPGFPYGDWKGAPDTTYPWKSRLGLVGHNRAALRYVVFKDQPIIGVISLVQLPSASE